MNARFKDWTDECQIRVWADKLRLEIGLVEDGESLELLLVLVRLVPHDEQRVSQPTPNTKNISKLKIKNKNKTIKTIDTALK